MNNLRENIVLLACLASNGIVEVSDLERSEGSLPEAGYTSVMLMSLIELLETNYGLLVSPHQDPEPLLSIDGIVKLVEDFTSE